MITKKMFSGVDYFGSGSSQRCLINVLYQFHEFVWLGGLGEFPNFTSLRFLIPFSWRLMVFSALNLQIHIVVYLWNLSRQFPKEDLYLQTVLQ